MKHALLALWVAAGLSLASAGATLAEVHLEQTVSSQLTAIHTRLGAAGKTTKSIDRQLALLGQIDKSSHQLLGGLNTTVTTSSHIAVQLGQLDNTVKSINGRVRTITSNTNGAATTLNQGIAPARRVNLSLGSIAAINRRIQSDLEAMLALNQSLNQTLEQTNRKLP